MGRREFLTTEMTPRAVRMLTYSVGGFLIYGMILFAELLQTVHLNRIDSQLKTLDQQVAGLNN